MDKIVLGRTLGLDPDEGTCLKEMRVNVDRDIICPNTMLRRATIHVLQANIQSVLCNLDELRSRIYQENPDVVLLQEDWLPERFGSRIWGYDWFHRARKMPRSTDEPRGGGVSILVRRFDDRIACEPLPDLISPTDSTEVLAVKLHFLNPAGPMEIYVINVYRPQVLNDNRTQEFDLENMLAPILAADQDASIMLCGDANMHSRLWDSYGKEDKLGKDAAFFLSENNFQVWNTGEPTFITKKARTAPDITCSHGDISVHNRQLEAPFGKCHHQVLSYDVIPDFVDPRLTSNDNSDSWCHTKISWSKVDWGAFNVKVLDIVQRMQRQSPPPSDPKAQVHYYTKALTHAFSLAARTLPRGSFTENTTWCTQELIVLLNKRNLAWRMAYDKNTESDWQTFESLATKFRDKMREERTKAWRDFCSSLDYSTDASLVTKVLDSLEDIPPEPKVPKVLLNPTSRKSLIDPRSQAYAFRSYFASVSRKPRIPPEKRQHFNQMHDCVRSYIKKAEIDPGPDALPFSMDELDEVIRQIRKRKARGPDDIFNEYLLNMTIPLKSLVLKLANLVWQTGEVPSSFTRSIIIPILKPNKPAKELKSYRPIALTSCLSKLIEKLVVTRLSYRLEHDRLLSNLQSGFRKGRFTIDTLMRLVSDVHLGFEAKPHLRTLTAKLDLTSAYNRVDHLRLLKIFADLHIPPVYARFYRSFLHNRIFQVHYRGIQTSWAKESCGTPQGTVSSPILFLIYMESMLRTISLPAQKAGIKVAMFADDLSLWKTGSSISYLATHLTKFISDSVQPWAFDHNMLFEPTKCAAFLFTNANTDSPSMFPVLINNTPLSYVSHQPPNKGPQVMRLLGVYFDRRLTMQYHVKYLCKKAGRRLSQLARVANSNYGMSQRDLRTMYISYIRSVLEFASPVWFPCISTTNMKKLQRIQNKALRIILGARLPTPTNDLHLEANIPPLHLRYQFATAFQAELYRRYPSDDPLYQLAHQALPNKRLKQRSSWQYISDSVLLSAGIFPSRNDVHVPPPDETLSLATRRPINVMPHLAPWDLNGYNKVHICPEIPHISCKRDSPETRLRFADRALSTIGTFDYSFWTDASLLNTSFGSAVALTYDCNNSPPNNFSEPETQVKRRRLPHEFEVVASPLGLIGSSTFGEKQALLLPPKVMRDNKEKYHQKRIFIGSDSRSCLSGMQSGPLRRRSPSHIDWTELWAEYLAMVRDVDPEIVVLQWTPAHVGIDGNEWADREAKNYAQLFSRNQQLQERLSSDLPTLRVFLYRHLKDQWSRSAEQVSARHYLLNGRRSNLGLRVGVPRAFQTLYSRWRLGEVESAGRYPRRLKWILSPMCRACGHPVETTVHLLTSCAGTSAYRANHGISIDTLVHETPANILRIAQFDAWIRTTFPFDQPISDFGLGDLLTATLKKRSLSSQSRTSEDDIVRPPTKRRRRFLVVPHNGLPTTQTSSSSQKRATFDARNAGEKQHAVKRPKLG